MIHFDIVMRADERAIQGVREYTEGDPVELRRVGNGRLAVVASNECGNRTTEVDLFDLLEALRSGPVESRIPNGFIL